MRAAAGILFAALCAGSVTASPLPAWLAGRWTATVGDVQMEELWTAEAGGLMLGLHRDVRRGSKASFEFLRIEKRGDEVVLVAQPGGQPPTVFKATATSSQRAVFENPAHDFPQRIVYELKQKQLCARVEGVMGEKKASEEWCWARTP